MSELEAAHARIAALEAELTTLREERVQMIDRLRQARSGNAPMIVPQPTAGTLPALWDHNRRFASVAAGKVTNVVCPNCRAAGDEIQMVRELGAGSAIAQESAYELEEVTCPRCLFTGWLRMR